MRSFWQRKSAACFARSVVQHCPRGYFTVQLRSSTLSTVTTDGQIYCPLARLALLSRMELLGRLCRGGRSVEEPSFQLDIVFDHDVPTNNDRKKSIVDYVAALTEALADREGIIVPRDSPSVRNHGTDNATTFHGTLGLGEAMILGRVGSTQAAKRNEEFTAIDASVALNCVQLAREAQRTTRDVLSAVSYERDRGMLGRSSSGGFTGSLECYPMSVVSMARLEAVLTRMDTYCGHLWGTRGSQSPRAGSRLDALCSAMLLPCIVVLRLCNVTLLPNILRVTNRWCSSLFESKSVTSLSAGQLVPLNPPSFNEVREAMRDMLATPIADPTHSKGQSASSRKSAETNPLDLVEWKKIAVEGYEVATGSGRRDILRDLEARKLPLAELPKHALRAARMRERLGGDHAGTGYVGGTGLVFPATT